MKRSSSLAETRCCIATRQGGSGEVAAESGKQRGYHRQQRGSGRSGQSFFSSPFGFLLAVVPGMPPLFERRVFGFDGCATCEAVRRPHG